MFSPRRLGRGIRDASFKITIRKDFVNFLSPALDRNRGFPVCSTHDFTARGCPPEHFKSDQLVVVLGIAGTMPV